MSRKKRLKNSPCARVAKYLLRTDKVVVEGSEETLAVSARGTREKGDGAGAVGEAKDSSWPWRSPGKRSWDGRDNPALRECFWLSMGVKGGMIGGIPSSR